MRRQRVFSGIAPFAAFCLHATPIVNLAGSGNRFSLISFRQNLDKATFRRIHDTL